MASHPPTYDVEEASDSAALLYSDERSSAPEDTIVNEKGFRGYDSRPTRSLGVKHTLSNPWTLHVTLISLYSFVFIVVLHHIMTRPNHGPGLVYSPARDIIEYEQVVFDASWPIKTPFAGEPRPELDRAWHDLLKNANIRISKDDLEKVGRTAVAYEDGSGYYAQLAVFHELHCLKRIRHYIHADYYYPNQTNDAREMNYRHTEHCLEIMRQGAMCRGDVSLVTFNWVDNGKIPIADFSIPHECVNFDAVDQWSAQRAVDIFEPRLLKHPTLGVSFPDGDHSVPPQ